MSKLLFCNFRIEINILNFKQMELKNDIVPQNKYPYKEAFARNEENMRQCAVVQ